MTINQLVTNIRQQLFEYYPSTEIDSFIRIISTRFLGLSQIDLCLYADREIPTTDTVQIQEVVSKLEAYHPIQYILGETEFFGLKFEVTPDVLIPRPETEELVDWIIKTYATKHDGSLRVLDIGTGSGCIAVSLAKHFLLADVWAMDISEQALAIAANNAIINEVQIQTVHGDILSDMDYFGSTFFDIIVSNPPYIGIAEKDFMHANVLDHEPHIALFPQHDNPLIFYDRIARFGIQHLNTGGSLFFEINEAYPEETSAMMQHAGYKDVEVRKDINDKWRMIRGVK